MVREGRGRAPPDPALGRAELLAVPRKILGAAGRIVHAVTCSGLRP